MCFIQISWEIQTFWPFYQKKFTFWIQIVLYFVSPKYWIFIINVIICTIRCYINGMNYNCISWIHDEINAKITFKIHVFSDHIQAKIFRISPKLTHQFFILILLSSNMFIEKVTKKNFLKIEYFTHLVRIF